MGGLTLFRPMAGCHRFRKRGGHRIFSGRIHWRCSGPRRGSSGHSAVDLSGHPCLCSHLPIHDTQGRWPQKPVLASHKGDDICEGVSYVVSNCRVVGADHRRHVMARAYRAGCSQFDSFCTEYCGCYLAQYCPIFSTTEVRIKGLR